MAETEKDKEKAEADARAKAQADAKAKEKEKAEADARAKTQAPADPRDVQARLVAALDNLEQRTRPAVAQSATKGLDQTDPGGRYLVPVAPGSPHKKLVNAHNRDLNDDGTLKYPEQQTVDIHGRLT